MDEYGMAVDLMIEHYRHELDLAEAVTISEATYMRVARRLARAALQMQAIGARLRAGER